MFFSALAAVLMCLPAQAANVREIYDRLNRHSLESFQLYLETPQEAQGRSQLTLTEDGLSATAGQGHFTGWKFADLATGPFTLDVVFEVPYADNSNSGIFILFADPRADVGRMTPGVRAQYLRGLELARERRRLLGNKPGPFELDYFAYEVQLCRGSDFAHEPRNKKTGAFYGIPVGEAQGQQRIFTPYDLNPGDTYHLRITYQDGVLRSFLRSVNYQDQLVPVAELKLKSREDDAIRGGNPIGLLLQAYWNNGTTAKLFTFKSIKLRN